jgi:hypothetical protein
MASSRLKRVACLVAALAAPALADPVVRPRPDGGEAPGTGVRPRSQFAPSGKEGYWVFRPGVPGGDLPWMRRWVEHPHEEPAPGEPDDVDGPG